MTLSDLEHFRNLLLEREQNISHWLNETSGASQNDVRKAQALLDEIKVALGRVEERQFGECKVCKLEVELFRLEVQPITDVCLDCITPKEKAQLQEDLYLASKIHRALLPQSIERVDGFDFAVRSLAARTVGGDYYDFIRDNNNALRLIIADTMGKGLPAGLLMSNIQGALRIMAEDIQQPQALVSRLNRWLCRNVPVTKFVSLACVLMELDSGRETRLTYTNAGHCAPIIIRANGKVEKLTQTGGVLGVHEGFEYSEQSLALYPGDFMLLYTDGVTEAENDNGDMFGEDRLVEFASGHRIEPLDLFLDNLIGEIQFFSGKTEISDDLTVLAVRKV